MANLYDADIDHAFLNSIKTPGLLEIDGSGSPRVWKVCSAFGVTGSTVIFGGEGLAKFDLVLKLYDRTDWAAWSDKQFQAVLKPPTRRDPQAISIAHPYLNSLGIVACVIEDVSVPHTDEFGVTRIRIKCLEYRKPQIALARPDGAKATPTDPVDVEIDSLVTLRNAQREALAR